MTNAAVFAGMKRVEFDRSKPVWLTPLPRSRNDPKYLRHQSLIKHLEGLGLEKPYPALNNARTLCEQVGIDYDEWMKTPEKEVKN